MLANAISIHRIDVWIRYEFAKIHKKTVDNVSNIRTLSGSGTDMRELLYHVNADDVLLGSVDRTKAHTEGILHRSGVVFVVSFDGKVLLQHRSPSKDIFPDCHECSAAFHVMFNESYEEAASRELTEETGISERLTYLGKFLHRDPPENQIVAVFLCRSNQPVRIDASESVGAKFYLKEEIDGIVSEQKVTPWLREGWKIARNKI